MNQNLREWLEWGDLRARLNNLFALVYLSMGLAALWRWFETGRPSLHSVHIAAAVTLVAAVFMFQGMVNVACLLGRLCGRPLSAGDAEIRNAATSRRWLRRDIRRAECLAD